MSTEKAKPKTIPDPVIKRTSINIPTDIWDEMRIAAIRHKVSQSEAVEAAIRYWVDNAVPGEEPRRKRA